MGRHRATPSIKCISCKSMNAYERGDGENWEIYCPDCKAVFEFDALPWSCSKCGARLHELADICENTCNRCRIEAWAPEKKAAINKLIGMAFREPKATDAEKDAAVDEAFRNL